MDHHCLIRAYVDTYWIMHNFAKNTNSNSKQKSYILFTVLCAKWIIKYSFACLFIVIKLQCNVNIVLYKVIQWLYNKMEYDVYFL